MLEEFDAWKLLAGLGIFLFGMFQLEEAIRELSGTAFRKLLRLYTNNRVKAILTGTVTTAILQSSSAVTLMVLAFVGAAIINMESAIGITIGANLGTTFTAWIVALLGFKVSIESFSLPLIGVGGVGMIFLANRQKLLQLCKLLMGFGFIFLGLDYMKTSVETVAAHVDIGQLPDWGIWVYAIFGLLLTAVMQSSSATIAIVLTALSSQLLSFYQAESMVIGANVGTTVTVLIGSVGGTTAKKRVALSHLIFNLITGLAAFSLINVFTWLIMDFFAMRHEPVVALALFHTLFNFRTFS